MAKIAIDEEKLHELCDCMEDIKDAYEKFEDELEDIDEGDNLEDAAKEIEDTIKVACKCFKKLMKHTKLGQRQNHADSGQRQMGWQQRQNDDGSDYGVNSISGEKRLRPHYN